LLCLGTTVISTFCYADNSRSLGRRTGWFTGLLGGVVAAATFCAPVFAGYVGLLNALEFLLGYLGFWLFLALTVALPILVGWYWPLFTARLSARQGSN
jgi:hypothetical protein